MYKRGPLKPLCYMSKSLQSLQRTFLFLQVIRRNFLLFLFKDGRSRPRVTFPCLLRHMHTPRTLVAAYIPGEYALCPPPLRRSRTCACCAPMLACLGPPRNRFPPHISHACVARIRCRKAAKTTHAQRLLSAGNSR